jgi:hypothetical protein
VLVGQPFDARTCRTYGTNRNSYIYRLFTWKFGVLETRSLYFWVCLNHHHLFRVNATKRFDQYEYILTFCSILNELRAYHFNFLVSNVELAFQICGGVTQENGDLCSLLKPLSLISIFFRMKLKVVLQSC